MKKRFSIILGIVLSVAMTFGSITASADTETVSRAQSLADGIIDFKLSEAGVSSVQEWIDGKLTENAGLSGEWYVFALSRYGNYDFSGYETALLEYLSEKEVRSASSRLKFALVLASVGSGDGYIAEAMSNSIGEQGVMSYIYGLHMLNNGYESTTATSGNIIDELLALQKSDGGWAVMGETGETDATAMAVQALAPYYNENEAVRTAVDEALALLSERQLEGGDFSSYGVPNPESTGQVLTALTSLGIDPDTDERFIKNNNTLIDGITLYRNEDGSFRHEADGRYNETATVQTLYCLVSYLRFSEGRTPLYILGNDTENIPEQEHMTPVVTESIETAPEVGTDISSPETAPPSETDYKPAVCIAIAGAAVISAVVLVLLKKGKKQNLIAVAAIAAAGIIFVLVTDFSSAEDYYGKTAEKEKPVGTVTLSIRCDTVAGKSDADYIPENGEILTDTFLIEENETAFDILVEAARKHSIQLDYSGSSDTVYVVGINYLYEFDFGDLSGWMYTVNDENPSVGCDGYILSDGDRISFLYTCEMGNDL